MRTATLRELRNDFSKLEVWLGEGEEIEIRKRGQPVAVLRGVASSEANAPAKPDFAARRRTIWGSRIFSTATVTQMRADELAGEEG